VTAPTTPEEAYAAGHAAWAAGVPLHDITGHLDLIGVPTALRGRWISGLEDAMEEDGVDTDPDSDGHAWERRALSGVIS
jgi:hypothetical protein